MVKRKTKEEAARAAQRELFLKLPFVSHRIDGPACWALPSTGGYGGGCIAGSNAAIAYMKYLRESTKSTFGGFLQSIVLGMAGAHADRSLRSQESIRGQIVGFFSTLDRYLRAGAHLASDLDKVGFEELSAEIRKGLALTRADEEAEEREERSRISKSGWITRRARNSRRRAA